MSDLSIIPLQDGYETQLSQDWDGNTGTVYVLTTPSYTPTTSNTYIVVNPGKTNMQIAEITSYDSTAKTLTVSSISFEKGLGISSTAQSHSTGSKVIISDNYQYWEDIQTAINSKLDITGANAVEYATTAARDSALGANGVPTTPYTNIYVTATGLFYNYNLSTAQWEAIDTGTTPGNATTSSAGLVRSDVAPAGIPVALITDNPKYDALAGTSGTPSTSNKYITEDDVATAATASKVARRLAGGNITVVTETTGNNTTNASSTAFVQQEILAAGIPSVNSIPNSILTSNSYFTQVLMPALGPVDNQIVNGWNYAGFSGTDLQGGAGSLFLDTAGGIDGTIFAYLPGKGSQATFRFADIGANALTLKTRLKLGTTPASTEALSWGLAESNNQLVELEDYTGGFGSIRFCIADNSGDKLYAVTSNGTNTRATDVTGALTITDWLNLAMVITSTQVLFYAGNGATLTLVATHTSASDYLPTTTQTIMVGWGVCNVSTNPDMYISPIYISLPTT